MERKKKKKKEKESANIVLPRGVSWTLECSKKNDKKNEIIILQGPLCLLSLKNK